MKSIGKTLVCLIIGALLFVGIQHNWPTIKHWADGSGTHSGVVRTDDSIDDGIGMGPGRPNSVIGDEDVERCGKSITYPALVNCKGGDAAYQAGLARNRNNLHELGDWSYIYNTAQRCKGAQAVGILISNQDKTDQQARDGLRQKWGDRVDSMPILPRQHGIINTMNHDEMTPFPDGTPQTRVVIVPLDDQCKPIVTSTYGIMADCLNGEWIELVSAAPPPQVAPPPPSAPPVCTQHCGPPVCTQHCGPPPVCTVNCGPPVCTVNCGPPVCTVNCGPPVCTVNCQPDCTQVLINCKPPVLTPQGPSVPGQEGHVNSDPGPGQYQPVTPPTPGPVFTPSPAPPAPTLAPDVTPAPVPVVIQPPDPGVVPSPGSPGSSDGRADGTAVMPTSFVVMHRSEVDLAA
jgi:hypothetical protein